MCVVYVTNTRIPSIVAAHLIDITGSDHARIITRLILLYRTAPRALNKQLINYSSDRLFGARPRCPHLKSPIMDMINNVRAQAFNGERRRRRRR